MRIKINVATNATITNSHDQPIRPEDVVNSLNTIVQTALQATWGDAKLAAVQNVGESGTGKNGPNTYTFQLLFNTKFTTRLVKRLHATKTNMTLKIPTPSKIARGGIQKKEEASGGGLPPVEPPAAADQPAPTAARPRKQILARRNGPSTKGAEH